MRYREYITGGLLAIRIVKEILVQLQEEGGPQCQEVEPVEQYSRHVTSEPVRRCVETCSHFDGKETPAREGAYFSREAWSKFTLRSSMILTMWIKVITHI